MAGSVSTLNFQITGDSAGLQAAAQRASASVRNMEAQVSRSTTQLHGFNKAGRNTGMMLLEASRGVEDFAVSFSTGGLAGGLRGAGNNIAQLATMMSPMAGAIAGVGVALGVTLIPRLFQTSDASKKLADDLSRIKPELDALEKQISGFSASRGMERTLLNLKTDEDAISALAGAKDDLDAATNAAEAYAVAIIENRRRIAEEDDKATRAAFEGTRETAKAEAERLRQLENELILKEQTARQDEQTARSFAKSIERKRPDLQKSDAIKESLKHDGEQLEQFVKYRESIQKEQDRLEAEQRTRIKSITDDLTALDARKRPDSVSAPSAAMGGSADAASIINRTVARAIDPHKNTEAKEAKRQRDRMLEELKGAREELTKLRAERTQGTRVPL